MSWVFQVACQDRGVATGFFQQPIDGEAHRRMFPPDCLDSSKRPTMRPHRHSRAIASRTPARDFSNSGWVWPSKVIEWSATGKHIGHGGWETTGRRVADIVVGRHQVEIDDARHAGGGVERLVPTTPGPSPFGGSAAGAL